VRARSADIDAVLAKLGAQGLTPKGSDPVVSSS
jgi:hypothetical protein